MDLQNNIYEYYSQIDKNIINDLYKNKIFKNLLELSIKLDIYLFYKKNNKWYLKNKAKFIYECEQQKKKEIKLASNLLSALIKLNNITLENIQKIYTKLENKIIIIDNFIIDLDQIYLPIKTKKKINTIENKIILLTETKNLMNKSLKNIKNTEALNFIINNTNIANDINISHSDCDDNDDLYESICNIKKIDKLDFIAYYSNS